MRRFFLFSLIFIGLCSFTLGGDLDSAWQRYSRTNAAVSELQVLQNVFESEQLEIKAEINRLQESSSWYNAWINKLLLSRYADQQLMLADSIQNVNRRLLELRNLQKADLKVLKQAYEAALLQTGSGEALARDEQEATLRVGRWLMDQSMEVLQLPDYRELVEGEYSNPELRQLVLGDLQVLLSEKLDLLDSLLDVRSREEELEQRLAEFHEDLGLQMRAQQDDISEEQDRSGSYSPAWSIGGGTDAIGNEGFYENTSDPAEDRTTKASEVAAVTTRRDLRYTDNVPGVSIQDLSWLELKRSEYEQLLQRILDELEPRP